jgi:hypothetical protein
LHIGAFSSANMFRPFKRTSPKSSSIPATLYQIILAKKERTCQLLDTNKNKNDVEQSGSRGNLSKTGMNIKNTQVGNQVDWYKTGFYIDCNNVRSTVNNRDKCILQHITVITTTILKLQKHLILDKFGETELGGVKWLKHTINTELFKAFL